ncbi:MAG: hypothetical protein IPO09_10485 [Anaeromyxobacter sp.]|nr:hypothetical protein [Anaeromyxobacter sp.]MBL0276681.1 hypothetical protein [Anaeromyxobacter sp.]
MTAIEILQTLGFVLVASLARAAFLVGVIAIVSIPLVLFAYSVRAAESFWSRHHLAPAHRHG